jgi:hypothetical protein
MPFGNIGREGEREGGREGERVPQQQDTHWSSYLYVPFWSIGREEGREGGREGGKEGGKEGGRDCVYR